MTKTIPKSFKDVTVSINELYSNGSTFDDFKELRDWCFNNKDSIRSFISKMTIAELCHYTRKDTKPKMVNSVLDAVLSSFTVGESISWTMGEKYDDVLKKIVYDITEEKFLEYKRQREEKRAAKKKALDNPETLDEFRTFIHYKGESAMSTDQKLRYDELMTDSIKDRKELEQQRKDKVTAVSMNDVDMLIQETVHTKKGHKLWVVKLSEYVDRSIFLELKDRAHKFDGYYSSFRGNGAIPGFTFTRKEAAEMFVAIKDGDVNSEALRKAINADKLQQRAEKLDEKAEVIEDRATESLSRDRKDNTVRRARMASHAEQRAQSELIFAKTMAQIATEMSEGTLVHLNRLSTAAQLETLNGLITEAKWLYIYDKKIREDNYEFTAEVMDYVKIPYPQIYKDTHNLILLKELSNDTGKALASNRMMKRLARINDNEALVINEHYMDDFERLFTYPSKHLTGWAKDRYKEQYLRYKRVINLGITTIYELRMALRELIRIKSGVTLTPEQVRLQKMRELERKFVGRKIDGFFPTPEELCAAVVELADIQPGHTILEPSAGLGHLAEAITDAHPDNELLCIEQYQPLHEALQLKELNAINMDFIQYNDQVFDRIVMNPPFENGQDIEHFLHAKSLLKTAGRIVCIMADNKDQDRYSDFKEFMDDYCHVTKNAAGSFMSAFRPTGVNTITVIYDSI